MAQELLKRSEVNPDFTWNLADMYVDIAIAYAVLGFVGSLILAKFIGGNKL